MTTQQIATKPPMNTSRQLTQYGSRDDILDLVGRLRTMLPGGDKLTDGQIKALAQASIAHGLDALNGEIWMIPGRGLMIGVKGLRRKGRDQVKGNFWPEFFELKDAEQRKRLRIPDGALAFECRIFDSENLRTYVETCERLLKAGIPWDAVRGMVGDKPYTPGIGVLKAGEQTKMEPVQCAMKRAEADALKRRFDIPFDVAVDDDGDGPAASEWVESAAPVADTESAEKQAATKRALYGDDSEPAPATPADNAAADREIADKESANTAARH